MGQAWLAGQTKLRHAREHACLVVMLSRSRNRPYLTWDANVDAPAESVHLQTEGWVLLPGVLTPDEVTELATDVRRVYDEYPPDIRRDHGQLGDWDDFRYEMLNRSAACQSVAGHRRILDVVEPLLGEDCHIIANTAWRNQQGAPHTHGGGAWHIDAGPHVPLPPGVDWDERIPHPTFAVACHVLLQDCPRESGPTGVIPRSHLSGQAPPAERRTDATLTWNGHEPVALEAHAGDVQLFVSDVWHRRMPTGPGDTGRLFLQIHYGRRDIAQRIRPTAHVNHLSSEAVARAEEGSDRDRTLIGLHQPFFYDG